MEARDGIENRILHDMTEGVVVIGRKGEIRYMNPSAARITGLGEDAVGGNFAMLFIGDEQNDGFVQTVLDALSEPDRMTERIVPFSGGQNTVTLHVRTSFLEKYGILIVFEDVSELEELRYTARYMEQIRDLNEELENRNEILNKTIGRYLSDEIVKKILETPGGMDMGGRKENLTVLMSDLRGFTAITERMDAQDLLSMLNHYLDEMTDAIHLYNGTVIEFIGDAVLAIFGTPLACENHAESGIAAAIEMQKRMPGINRWNEEHGYPQLKMGIGVNSGDAIVGNIGSERHAKYGVTGQLVNICGRIESFSVGGQVLAGPETVKMVRTDLQVEEVIRVFPKGSDVPIDVSRITGIGKPYDSHFEVKEQEPEKVDKPVRVSFNIIREKRMEMEKLSGLITAASTTNVCLKTDAELEPYDNIRIETRDMRTYGKVISRSGDEYNVRLTYTD